MTGPGGGRGDGMMSDKSGQQDLEQELDPLHRQIAQLHGNTLDRQQRHLCDHPGQLVDRSVTIE